VSNTSVYVVDKLNQTSHFLG